MEQKLSEKDSVSVIDVILKMKQSDVEGYHQTLINTYLYGIEDSGTPAERIEFYLPQLVNIYAYQTKVKFSALERFLLERCTKSLHFALLFGFLVDSETNFKPIRKKLARIKNLIDEAVINSLIPLSEEKMLDRSDRLRHKLESVSLEKQKRLIVYNQQISFIHFLTALTRRLLLYPMGKMRTDRLRLELEQYSRVLPNHIYYPFQNGQRKKIVNIIASESFAISTKERVPCLIYFETVQDDNSQNSSEETSDGEIVNDANLEQSFEGFEVVSVQDTRLELLNTVFGESWKDRSKRIRKNSLYQNNPTWRLESLIAKSNDDIRQEHFTMQVISLLKTIWIDEAKLPIQLTTYQFLVTGTDSGCIETLKDCCSIDNLMKKYPNYTSLLDYFTSVYGPIGSDEFEKAQLNFIESMAASSVICYLLQIKDRHNGNIMIHRDGSIVHIDFGFLMSNSPMKGFGFETAPFKLTEEFAQVIGGCKENYVNTTMFRHFRMLIYVLMRAATQNMERICNFIETMLPACLAYPCFQSQGIHGNATSILKSFRDRFRCDLDEEKYGLFTKKLIDESLLHQRTTQYDSIQWMTNGIQYRY